MPAPGLVDSRGCGLYWGTRGGGLTREGENFSQAAGADGTWPTPSLSWGIVSPHAFPPFRRVRHVR
ncbi:Hypothetical protein AA314_04253 [Archangium gephyra]|uniref:Uncharacterized protein n=1 Tax=Archangium gephyra TaxID=48 RepID=A0AAC8TE54_9BACT|nr:Hypothetical protein AA314_04253 [Archangium gephyra]